MKQKKKKKQKKIVKNFFEQEVTSGNGDMNVSDKSLSALHKELLKNKSNGDEIKAADDKGPPSSSRSPGIWLSLCHNTYIKQIFKIFKKK